VPNANIVFGGSGSNRTVTVTPAATRFGAATITVTVTDGNGGSASAAFQLTVSPVNDAPAFDAISNLTINENAGTQTINLTGISAGPNENQVVAFSAASSNPALIPNPTVNYNSPAGTGMLTFLPAPGVSGTSVITVTANDGQTLSNTFARAFIVTVNPLPRISAVADQTINEDTSS